MYNACKYTYKIYIIYAQYISIYVQALQNMCTIYVQYI